MWVTMESCVNSMCKKCCFYFICIIHITYKWTNEVNSIRPELSRRNSWNWNDMNTISVCYPVREGSVSRGEASQGFISSSMSLPGFCPLLGSGGWIPFLVSQHGFPSFPVYQLNSVFPVYQEDFDWGVCQALKGYFDIWIVQSRVSQTLKGHFD